MNAASWLLLPATIDCAANSVASGALSTRIYFMIADGVMPSDADARCGPSELISFWMLIGLDLICLRVFMFILSKC